MKNLFKVACLCCVIIGPHAKADITSIYKKVDFDSECSRFGMEEIEGGAGALVCRGIPGYSIILTSGDLRESIEVVVDLQEDHEITWNSFSQWNRVNNVFEFRMVNGVAEAMIHRVFIDNADPKDGSVNQKYQGQMLVVTSVGRGNEASSCMVGAVDALENRNANELARQVADNYAPNFLCNKSQPIYYGKRGNLAGHF